MRLAIKTFIFAIYYFQTISIIIYCFDLHRCFCQLKHWFNFLFLFGIRFIKVWYHSGFHFTFFFVHFANCVGIWKLNFKFIQLQSYKTHRIRWKCDTASILPWDFRANDKHTADTRDSKKTNSESCMCIFFAHNSARFISYVWKLTLAKNTMLIGSVFLVNCKKLPTDNFPQQKSLDVPFFCLVELGFFKHVCSFLVV